MDYEATVAKTVAELNALNKQAITAAYYVGSRILELRKEYGAGIVPKFAADVSARGAVAYSLSSYYKMAKLAEALTPDAALSLANNNVSLRAAFTLAFRLADAADVDAAVREFLAGAGQEPYKYRKVWSVYNTRKARMCSSCIYPSKAAALVVCGKHEVPVSVKVPV